MAMETDHVAMLSDLLQLVEKAAGHPKLKPISDAAMKLLEEYSDGLVKDAQPEPEPEPEWTEPEEEASLARR